MKATIRMIRRMVKEISIGLMAGHTKATGKQVSKMVKVCTPLKVAKSDMASGKKESAYNGLRMSKSKHHQSSRNKLQHPSRVKYLLTTTS